MRRTLSIKLLIMGSILTALGFFFIVAAIVTDVFFTKITIVPASTCGERTMVRVSEEAIWINDSRIEVRNIEQALNDLAMQPEKPCLLLFATDDYGVKFIARVKQLADKNSFDVIIMTLSDKRNEE